MIYYLSERLDGRVILDTEIHGKEMEVIHAKTWLLARQEIITPVAHNHGYGYILNDYEGEAA